MAIGLEEAVAWIGGGGVLAFPTETVWGLAVDARSEAAVGALRDFKGRGGDAPISVLVTGVAALAPLGFEVAPAAQRLARDFWPGPLTLVLDCRGAFAAGVGRDDGAIGVRCSSHPLAARLAGALEKRALGPITATSCNRSGDPAARTRAEAQRVCGEDERLRVLADAPDATGEVPSTVVDLTGKAPRVLRWGALSETVLAPVLAEIAA
jgi:tRNA threonylcarbamoyl adenosine modification protein (Sua5/YciO/YrdC/YwlC family)